MKITNPFSFEERSKKTGTIAYYIKEVIRYHAKYESSEQAENGYPPVVPELLLSLLIEVRTFLLFGRLFFGALLFLVLKAIFLGS